MRLDSLFKPTWWERVVEMFRPRRRHDREDRARRHLHSLIERHDRESARERRNR